MAPGVGAVDGMVQLRKEGLIENVSIGMNDAAFVLRMIEGKPKGTFNSVMLAGSWNLLDQSGLEVLKACEARGVDVHNAGVFASGLLVGGATFRYMPRRRLTWWRRPTSGASSRPSTPSRSPRSRFTLRSVPPSSPRLRSASRARRRWIRPSGGSARLFPRPSGRRRRRSACSLRRAPRRGACTRADLPFGARGVPTRRVTSVTLLVVP